VGRAIGGGVRSIEVGEGVVIIIDGLLLGLLLGVGLAGEVLGLGETAGDEGTGLVGLGEFTVGGGAGLLLWGGLVVVGVDVGVAIGLTQRSIWSLNTQPLLPLGC
jgi:hypothetical protein